MATERDVPGRPHHLAPPGELSFCAYCEHEYIFASSAEREDHYLTCVVPKIDAALRSLRQGRETS